MACLWKHFKSRFWFARFTDATGKRVNRSTRETKRSKARVIADAWERAAREARAGIMTRSRALEVVNELLVATGAESIKVPTLAELFDEWLADVRAGDASEQTMNRYRTVRRHFDEHMGDRQKVPITGVSTSEIQRFVNDRLKDRESKTVLNDLRAISAAFNFAVRMGYLERNPCVGVEIEARGILKRRPFSPALIPLLIDAAPNDEWRLLIRICWFTGLRLGDASQLTWEQIDLAAGVLEVTQEKTGDEVRLPLHAELREALEEAAGDTTGPVLPELSQHIPGGKAGLSAQFGAIVKAAGIDEQRVETKSGRSFARLSAHSLRHGVTTALADADVAPDVRQKITGHADLRALAIYSHHGIETVRRAVEKIPSLKIRYPKNSDL